MVTAIYDAAFAIWKAMMDLSLDLFKMDPLTANADITTIVTNLYNALKSISVPIATIFFIIALLKDVVTSSSREQTTKIILDGLKFAIMIGIVMNLWDLMKYIMQIAQGITTEFASVTAASTKELRLSTEFQTALTEALTKPSGLDLGEWAEYFGSYIVAIIAAIATLFTVIASGISIISCAYQRILKPLVILPFACLNVAMGSGSGEASRAMSNFIKTFFGFCISGAFMVVSVGLGNALMGGINFPAGTHAIMTIILLSVQVAITPVVTAGLIKSIDSIVSRIF